MSPSSSTHLSISEQLQEIHLNLNGSVRFRVGFNQNIPYARLKPDGKNWIMLGGADCRLLETLSQHFNFTYELFNMENNYGHPIPPENRWWSGFTGMIANKTLDMGMGGWALTYERALIVDNLYPRYLGRTSFITMGSTNQNIHSPYIIFQPFDYIIWVMILMYFLLTIVLGRLVHLVNAEQEKFNKQIGTSSHNLIWVNVQLLLKQPVTYLERLSPTAKVISYVWIFASLILTTAYAGCLSSLISIPRINTIDSLDELAEQCKQGLMTVLVVKDTAPMNVLLKSTQNSHQEIAKQLKPVKSSEEAVELILQSSNNGKQMQYSFIRSWILLKNIQYTYGAKRIHVAKKYEEASLFMTIVCWPLKPGFPYQKQFNHLMGRTFEYGFYHHWLNEEFQETRRRNSRFYHMTSKEMDEETKMLLYDENQDEIGSIMSITSSLSNFVFF